MGLTFLFIGREKVESKSLHGEMLRNGPLLFEAAHKNESDVGDSRCRKWRFLHLVTFRLTGAKSCNRIADGRKISQNETLADSDSPPNPLLV